MRHSGEDYADSSEGSPQSVRRQPCVVSDAPHAEPRVHPLFRGRGIGVLGVRLSWPRDRDPQAVHGSTEQQRPPGGPEARVGAVCAPTGEGCANRGRAGNGADPRGRDAAAVGWRRKRVERVGLRVQSTGHAETQLYSLAGCGVVSGGAEQDGRTVRRRPHEVSGSCRPREWDHHPVPGCPPREDSGEPTPGAETGHPPDGPQTMHQYAADVAGTRLVQLGQLRRGSGHRDVEVDSKTVSAAAGRGERSAVAAQRRDHSAEHQPVWRVDCGSTQSRTQTLEPGIWETHCFVQYPVRPLTSCVKVKLCTCIYLLTCLAVCCGGQLPVSSSLSIQQCSAKQ